MATGAPSPSSERQTTGTGGRRRTGGWTVSRLLAVGYAIAFGALAVIGISSYMRIGALAEERRAVEQTQQTIDRIEDLRDRLKDAERGQRGYLITGQDRYLHPYRQALPRIEEDLAALQRMTGEDPRQQTTLTRLQQPMQERLDALDETIRLRREQSFQAARDVVLSDRGAWSMIEIETLLNQMEAEEERLLELRQRSSVESAADTRNVILWGSLLAALLVAVAARWATRKVTGSVDEVAAAARRVAAGDVTRPAQVTEPVELAQMAEAVNGSVQVIARARDEALAAAAAKASFLATMSHEIRTPMNAVIGMTDLLLETDLDTDQRELADTVRNSGEALLSVINDILDYSKIEAGQLDLDDEPFDVRECVEGTLALMALAAESKGLELVGDVSPDCPRTLRGDVTRLRQVIVNLLSNAVKFTDRGEIVVTADGQRLSERDDGPVRLRVAVRDTGIGIPAERMDRLFRSFSQVDSSTTRVYGGTGLGLAISRRLARAMGGDLEVESEVGVGSTFTLTAVLAGCPECPASMPTPAAVALAGKSALVVDDNATNRRVLRLQLANWGMVCTDVGTPGEAVDLVTGGRSYDVAVLDMHMPEMSGEQLAGVLRDLPVGRDLPLVLLTSVHWRARLEQKELFDAVLTKPARSAVLREKMAGAIARRGAATSEAETAGERREGTEPGGAARKGVLNVLLAEDNPVNQKVAQLMLARLGHRVDTVDDGAQAVEAVRRTSYDVILMDMHMPNMDGLEATRRIRAEQPETRPYIVALTASVLGEDQEACRNAGMDDYLAKPVRAHELGELLEPLRPAQVGLGTAGPAPAAGVSGGGISPPEGAAQAGEEPDLPPKESERPSRETSIRERLDELAGPDAGEDDWEMVDYLATSFVAKAPSALEELEEAVARGHAGDVEKRAHSLKGSAVNMGATALAELCARLEAQGRSGELSATVETMQPLREELDLVCRTLRTLRPAVGEEQEPAAHGEASRRTR
ncbi:response regulator [Planomonospora algeriensis]